MRVLASCLLVVAAGCGPDAPVIDGEDDGPGGGNGDEEIVVGFSREVDILFVIDNSGSMSEEQNRLAEAIPSFVNELDAAGLDYRIGVTTTDNGNPWCTSTTPEAGALRSSSCRARLDEFVFTGATTGDFPTACVDWCAWDTIEVRSTPTAVDDEARPRPWIESVAGRTNVAGGVCAEGEECGPVPTTAEALQCLLPQGIDGCGFEQQLESMHKALTRSETEGDDAFGFLRPHADLVVVIVTDEADCSVDSGYDTIFEADGERTFWSLPEEEAPTSAVCWNAGVACDGGSCQSASYDVHGKPTSEDAAVMHPVSRYVNRLREFAAGEWTLAGRQVSVALIAGADVDGSVNYADAWDWTFHNDFGIGPGCASSAGTAVPPVRMRELAEALSHDGEQNIFSVCADDYGPILDTIAFRTAARVTPPCVLACVADSKPTTPILDPSCRLLRRQSEASAPAEIPPCEEGGQLPPGTSLCFRPLVDGRLDASGKRVFLTEDPGDDMSPLCADLALNLEVGLVRGPGVSLPPRVDVDCDLSFNWDADCPALPR